MCQLSCSVFFNNVHQCSLNHLYITLLWNCIERCKNMSLLQYDHMSWVDDHLEVLIPTNKSDQAGERTYGKAVYSNPNDPYIDVLFCLGIHILSNCHNGRSQLVYNCASEKFSEWLYNAMHSLSSTEQIELLGDLADKFGTHSLRKGVLSICSQTFGGPPLAAIFLRAGKSFGAANDPYMGMGDTSGDCQAGRMAAGLNLNETSFASLPCRFRLGKEPSYDDMKIIVMGYDNYPENFKQVIKYAIASVVHFHDHLTTIFDPTHPFFDCVYFRHKFYLQYKDYILLGEFTCNETNMRVSGVPQTNYFIRDMKELKEILLKLQSYIMNSSRDTTTTHSNDVINHMTQHLIQLNEGMKSVNDRLTAIENNQKNQYPTIT